LDVAASVFEAAPLFLGAVIINLTTGDPDRMARCGAQLAARGIGYVDAQVHRDLLAEVERAGLGADENSAIIRAFERI
jgi:hypothetical protein